MKRFAGLLDQLVFTPSRNGKLRLIQDYARRAPDPDRGYAVAALTGALAFARAKPALVRGLAEQRVDPVLFRWSYDFVGDLAETVALSWPGPAAAVVAPPPRLGDVVARLERAGRSEIPALLAAWLDALDATGRWALLKLITGSLRVGVSAGLVRAALAEIGKVEAAQVQEVWHALAPPYEALFAWLEGRGERPSVATGLGFRPMMLAQALDEAELAALDPSAYRAEWKWDGIRIQLAGAGGRLCLYSRTGDEIARSFPDLVEPLAAAGPLEAVLDGELLVARAGTGDRLEPAPFSELQQRLNRKTVTAAMMRDRPVFIRAYDLLFEGAQDLRDLPFDERRRRLEHWIRRRMPPRIDLSPAVAFAHWDELAALRAEARACGVEGLMLKRGDSPYVAGRPKGPWFKWKRGPLVVDAVLMYAQRGHGKRSSYYSDYTFGCWRPIADGTGADGTGRELVPVGKAYFGFTDLELVQLDKFVREHTIDRFGPVRVVEPSLVLEIACDGVQRSTRHKSGVAMRFPRIHRLRWDKPAEEADEVATLEKAIEAN
ncbi:MAG: cisplatin damage response ATP-dependent DNA ligase [Alphaproteobacteria bacterium]|nr:cisplatin damage response ATP-dependent DNA ligase [Alphaproteobacteria bacterium]